MTDPAAFLSPRDFAMELRVTKRTIDRMIREGRIPAPQRWNARVLRWSRTDPDVIDILTTGPKAPGTFTPPPKGEAPPKKTTRSPKKKGGKK
jgi:hypothetical protein